MEKYPGKCIQCIQRNTDVILWGRKLTTTILELHRKIWQAHNKMVHGKTQEEARKRDRNKIIARVKEIYK
jgi:hypothetical protein